MKTTEQRNECDATQRGTAEMRKLQNETRVSSICVYR